LDEDQTLHPASEISATDERKDETSWRVYEELLLATSVYSIRARDIKSFFH
jgi:hypothetical protein